MPGFKKSSATFFEIRRVSKKTLGSTREIYLDSPRCTRNRYTVVKRARSTNSKNKKRPERMGALSRLGGWGRVVAALSVAVMKHTRHFVFLHHQASPLFGKFDEVVLDTAPRLKTISAGLHLRIFIRNQKPMRARTKKTNSSRKHQQRSHDAAHPAAVCSRAVAKNDSTTAELKSWRVFRTGEMLLFCFFGTT